LRERPYKASIEISLSDEEALKGLFYPIKPELKDRVSERINVNGRLEGHRLTIEISASDITALRAAINSYLRILSCLVKLTEELKKRL